MSTNPIFLSLPEDQLLALAAYGEARGEGSQGMQAVLHTIMNRAQYKTYQDSALSSAGKIHAVILKPLQFSAFNANDPNSVILGNIAESFLTNVNKNKDLKTAYDLALKVKNSQMEDITNGATHYHTTAVNPSWKSSLTFLGQIGNHLFYKNSWEKAIEVAKSPVAWGFIIMAGFATYIFIKKLMI